MSEKFVKRKVLDTPGIPQKNTSNHHQRINLNTTSKTMQESAKITPKSKKYLCKNASNIYAEKETEKGQGNHENIRFSEV